MKNRQSAKQLLLLEVQTSGFVTFNIFTPSIQLGRQKDCAQKHSVIYVLNVLKENTKTSQLYNHFLMFSKMVQPQNSRSFVSHVPIVRQCNWKAVDDSGHANLYY